MKKWFLTSFQGYKKEYLKSDLMAALVVTAIAIPESLGYAVIVGLPVQTGLYCALIAPIIFAIFASTKRLIIGADSATAALVAAGAASVAAVGSPEYGGAIATLGVLTGATLIAMGLLKFGFLADFISRPVLIGFISGVGVQLILGKFPEMLGMEAHGNLIAKVVHIFSNLGEIHWQTVGLSALVVITMFMATKKKLPGALIGLGMAIVATILFGLAQQEVKMVGAVPAGFPQLSLPTLSVDMVINLVMAAFSIAIVILAQSSSVVRTYAAKHDEAVDDNRDLIALGFANISSALTQGFAVNGSPPRTSASEHAGGRSQLVNVFMAIFVGLVLLFATGLFDIVPMAALAAIVFMIGFHLIKVDDLKDIWRVNKGEFLIAIVALGGVAILGVRQGIIIAVIISLIERLRREYRPSDQILLRDQELDDWADLRLDSHHKYSSRPAGLLVYRFDSAIFFENSSYFSERVRAVIAEAKKEVTSVIIDSGSITDLDYTSAHTIRRLHQQLSEDNIRFGFAHVSPELRQLFRRYGLTNVIGAENIYDTLNEAIKDQPESRRSAIDMVKRLHLPERSCVVIGGGVLEVLGLRTTRDIDLVVSQRVYNSLRHRGWSEYTSDEGKRILSHKGYKIMTTYMHRDLQRLLRHSFVIRGVHFMGLEDLLKSKTAMGRRKDKDDIKRIHRYLAWRSKQAHIKEDEYPPKTTLRPSDAERTIGRSARIAADN